MKKIIFTLSTAIFFVSTAFAQLGNIDPDFIPGTGFGPDQWTGKCEAIVQQPDGKLLVGGQFKTFDGDSALYITRLNLDGSRDLSFSSPFEENWGYNIRAIVLQNDGRIIIGGTFNEVNGISQNRIARLNSDGSLDLTFNPASGFNQEVTAIELQPDGKILAGGLFTVFDYVWGGSQTPVNGIARLNSDGSIDNTFNVGTGFSGGTGIGQRQIHKIVVQPDGKILVGGHYSSYNGNASILLTRLNSDGTIDSSFDASANFSPAADGFYGQVYAMKLLPDGKIMIAGNYGNTNSAASGIDRLNSDGTLDVLFQTAPSNTDLRCFALDVQSDGKVVGASVNFGIPSEAFVVERYNTDGSLDTTFPQKYLNNDVTDLIIQNDGNITFVGYFNYNPMGIMRLLGDGTSSVNLTEESTFDFSVYPNPTSEFVNINNIPQNSILRIINLTGKVMYEQIVLDNFESVNVSGFTSGIYLIQIENNGRVANKKLIIGR